MVSYRKEIPSSLDMLPLGERFGDKNKARMRARPNAKFSHIRSSIDHGKKEKKVGLMETKDENHLMRRKGENFGRIAPQTLANYITAGHDATQLSNQLDDIQILRTGKFPSKRPPTETTLPKIVLLDLRSPAEYRSGHIRNAISFPAENIQKDLVFAKLSMHKNKPDKILVVYHQDERHGILQCRIIFEKGFDNVYLLSGGTCIFEQEHPDLIERATRVLTPRKANPSTQGAAGEMTATGFSPNRLAALALPGVQQTSKMARPNSTLNYTRQSMQIKQLKH